MNTIAYVLIVVGLLIVRGVTKGRSLSEIPGDLADTIVGALSGDTSKTSDALSRVGTPVATAPVVSTPGTSTGVPGVTNTGMPTNGHDTTSVVALGKWLTAKGYAAGEGPAPFGPIHPVHVKGSYHYRNLALDVNWRGKGTEKAALDAIAPSLVAAGWRVIWQTKGHYDHLHVDGGPAGRVTL